MSAPQTRRSSRLLAPLRAALAPGLLAGVALLGLHACAGTDVGNPEAERTVNLEFAAHGGEVPGALSAASSVMLDDVWLVFDTVDLWTVDGCRANAGNGNATGSSSTNLLIEMLDGRELPAAPMFAPDSERMCRLKLTPGGADAAQLAEMGLPGDLADVSLVVRGRRADGEAFTMALSAGPPILLGGAGDEQGTPHFDLVGVDDQLLATLALSSLFDARFAADLDALSPAELALITDATAPSLAARLRGSLSRAFVLVRDDNRDGQLQTEELDAVLARPE